MLVNCSRPRSASREIVAFPTLKVKNLLSKKRERFHFRLAKENFGVFVFMNFVSILGTSSFTILVICSLSSTLLRNFYKFLYNMKIVASNKILSFFKFSVVKDNPSYFCK